jgi:hypothetical protein
MNLLFLFSFLLNILTVQETKTVSVRAVLPLESLIVNRKWEMQEIRFLYDNTNYYYNKYDYANSNANFDNDYITFDCGGTGIYHQSDKIEYPLKWRFSAPKNNKLQFTISKFRNNSDLLVTWENIEFLNNTIKYTEYYTHKGGKNSLGCGIRQTTDTISTPLHITAVNRQFCASGT